MIIIGEKINGAIPSVKQAISEHNTVWIQELALKQIKAGAQFIDCAPSTATDIEYETMVWMIDAIQEVTDAQICIDSPDARLLARIIEEDRLKRPGMINSVNEEGDKCEVIFPLIAGTEWSVVGLTCDRYGIPSDSEKKLEIAKRIINKAIRFGVKLSNLHIDPCVMALSTVPDAMYDFETMITEIHRYAKEVNVTGAISNISFEMPARRYVNLACVSYAIRAGLNSAICDPCNSDMMGTVYAAEALCQMDKAGRKYNRAYRQGKFGVKNKKEQENGF